MKEEIIYNVFENQVAKNPDAIAIIDENRKLTRSELDQLVNTIASKLDKDSKTIGIIMDHSIEMIASILAVLKLGKTYVPIEPFFPIKRIEFILNDSGADMVITNSQYQNKLKDFKPLIIDSGFKIENIVLDTTASPEDLAYILYTSGSTGKPKGVAVTNKNVTHYVQAYQNEFHPTENDRILQYSVCTFDIFVEEVFSALLSGSALVIPSPETRDDMDKLVDFIDNSKVSIISGFPYFFLDLNNQEKIPESLRLVLSGGDVLRADFFTNLMDKVDVYNTYGPSETTVCVSYYHCNGKEPLEDGTYPIGKPILNTEIKILDESLNPVKFGEIGEICIKGKGVSNGYIGDRNYENRAFVTEPDGSILYRTGDLGYCLPDGNIAFLHRKDSQIMIEGKRVEPYEVESVINNLTNVEKAIVRSFNDSNNFPYMVAYIVFKDDSANLNEVTDELKNFLPDYMIPEYFIQMNDLPLTENGKVDMKSLPKIEKDGRIN